MPVAAPISGVALNTWPIARSCAASGEARNAGSAWVAAVLRWLARGAAMACSSVRPRSTRPVSTWSTVVMMVAPPGEPSAR